MYIIIKLKLDLIKTNAHSIIFYATPCLLCGILFQSKFTAKLFA